MPVAVTWNVPLVPYTADVLFAEVIDGAVVAAVTVSVKLCNASGLMPFVAPTIKL